MFRVRTTIALNLTTKSKLDKSKAPGQCYDGFLCQLIDLWEKTNPSNNLKNQFHRTSGTGISSIKEVAEANI